LLCGLQETDGEVKLGFNGDLYPSAGASVVMTTSGDMVKYQSGARARLGIGSANQLLQVKSSLPSWETVDLADTVLTIAGDILFENATPELARLPKGTQYNNLQMGSALPAWASSSTSILSASGDILYASGSNTLAKLAKASDGDTLQLASGVPAWVTVAGGGTQVYGIFSISSAQNAVAYGSPFGTFFGESADDLAEATIDAGMTMTNFKAKAVLNAKDGATTWVWRDDNADIGTPLSVDAGSTAEFSSGTVSIAITAGSKFSTKRDTSASSSGAFMLAFLLGQVDY